MYDPGHGSFDTMAPIAAYAEHEQVVTTLCPWPSNPNIFVSGSTDATIRIWDRRVAAHSVGMFGTVDSATNYARAHGDTITCVDVMGDLLVSTGGWVGGWRRCALLGVTPHCLPAWVAGRRTAYGQ